MHALFRMISLSSPTNRENVMLKISNLILALDHPDQALEKLLLQRLGIAKEDLLRWQVHKRSVDARRKGAIKLVYSVMATVRDEENVLKNKSGDSQIRKAPDLRYQAPAMIPKKQDARPVIVGTGPAGLFAGLILAEAGLQPLLLERGKKVRERSRDTFGFWRGGQLNPESNVQFGEGGAGTFSDGKLYTRIKDDHNRDRKVLQEFVQAGAQEEILWEARPHIGTLKLVKIVEAIRKKIIQLGGEYRFQSRVVDLIVEDGSLQGFLLASGERVAAEFGILAVGHSARKTFEMLARRGVSLAPKPFSVGVRIEHPQPLIDSSQYGKSAGHPQLGAAEYQLVHHTSLGRSVYSFCMCPGGTVLAASSEPGMVVTNGMSQHSRQERNANSALVVEVTPKDFPDSPLGGIRFQQHWEREAFIQGGGNYFAPVQRLEDFLVGRKTARIGTVVPSYQPGVRSADLHKVLPAYVAASLKEALPAFQHKVSGFILPDAVLTGVETRTSSPVRILRREDLQSVNVEGLYPAGEGSGYAGGILSSAVDGIKAAERILIKLNR